MSTNCPHCGYKDNEVKSGGAISPQGKKITLKVENEEDIARDILKVCPTYHPVGHTSNQHDGLRAKLAALRFQKSILFFMKVH